MMKKMLKIIICLLCLFTIESKIKANNKTADDIILDNQSFGYGTPAGEGPCGEQDGCGIYGNEFVLRMGLYELSDYGYKLVDGTRIVQFRHDSEDSYSRPYSYNVTNADFQKTNTWREYKTQSGAPMITGTDSDGFNEIDIVIGGMNQIQRPWYFQGNYTQPEAGPYETYYTNLGIGKDAEEGFKNVEKNRKNMIDYVTNYSSRKNKVPGEDRYVSFLDFFLHVCGFNSDWKSDFTTKKKIAEGKYYLIIEPVYWYGGFFTDSKGVRGWHTVEGTAKQLADFASYKVTKKDSLMWMAYDEEIIYNHYCNYVDLNYEQLFVYGDIGPAQLAQNICPSSRSFYNYYRYINKLDVLQELANPVKTVGVNIVSLSRAAESMANDYRCTYAVSTCNDNNFMYETQLQFNYKSSFSQSEGTKETASGVGTARKERLIDAESVYNCINPYGISEEKMSQYIYTIGTDDKKLWCYDNVTYDFTSLKTLQDKTYYSNQLITIPNGKLTVNRTCYAPKLDVSSDVLNTVFNEDFSETWRSNNYQKKFTFNFNGQTYEFVRDVNRGIQHETKSGNLNYIKETLGDNGIGSSSKGKVYTSKFSYYYKLSNSIDPNARININTYNINSGLQSTNSIKFKSKTEGSIIKLGGVSEEKTVENSISAQLGTDSYGLSNTIVRALFNSNYIYGDPNIIIDYDEDQLSGRLTKINSELEFVYEKTEDDSCEFETELTKPELNARFRVISLDNPFPARDGSLRIAGSNWANEEENNIYNYIQNNRGVKTEEVYNKEPLYKITLTPTSMIQIREYNKTHSYGMYDITCEEETGKQCISNFLRTSKYVNGITGTCASIQTADDITNRNNEITEYLSHCLSCDDLQYDTNNDKKVTTADYLNSKYYECADKTAKSGG